MNNKKETKMNISIKESMLLRKCINNYMLENKLDYDKSPLFNGLIHKLKEYEKPKNNMKKLILDDGINWNLTIQRNTIDSQRKALNKELKKYSIQTTCNEKILELIKDENKMKENNIKDSLVVETNKKED